MTQFAPLFVIYIKDDDENHLSLGKTPETLCGYRTVTSAFQVEDLEEPLKNMDIDKLCEECENKLDIAEKFINTEPTVECDVCGYNYGASVSRTVESMDDGVVPVCRPCYDQLLDSEDSGVSKSYSEAEPYYETDESRSFDASDSLENKWENLGEET